MYVCNTSICQMNAYTRYIEVVYSNLCYEAFHVFLKKKDQQNICLMYMYMSYMSGIYFSSQMPQTLQNASFPYMLIS